MLIYLLIFFPDLGVLQERINNTPPTIIFSVKNELFQIIFLNIPTIALIWYLVKKRLSSVKPVSETPLYRISNKKSFFNMIAMGGVGFVCLFLIGTAVSYIEGSIAGAFPALPEVPDAGVPKTAFAIPVMILSCFSTAYLEESFFRFFLAQRLNEVLSSILKAMLISTVLFAAAHLWEGPWGVINALFAGIFLSCLFQYKKSLHSIALAHALYNISVYIM
ncbi:hypothetical protein AGMMS50212_01690 [Spirochaetia bacterium]|nr:hypothetical protein AGMMS50212_01690 [Spirochaetia bacterium]